jgi:hypothetical protein
MRTHLIANRRYPLAADVAEFNSRLASDGIRRRCVESFPHTFNQIKTTEVANLLWAEKCRRVKRPISEKFSRLQIDLRDVLSQESRTPAPRGACYTVHGTVFERGGGWPRCEAPSGSNRSQRRFAPWLPMSDQLSLHKHLANPAFFHPDLRAIILD